MNGRTLTALIHKNHNVYVAECPEVGTLCQGESVEKAVANLKEATETYLESFFLRDVEELAFVTVELT